MSYTHRVLYCNKVTAVALPCFGINPLPKTDGFSGEKSIALRCVRQRQCKIWALVFLLGELESVNSRMDFHIAKRAFQDQVINWQRISGFCLQYQLRNTFLYLDRNVYIVYRIYISIISFALSSHTRARMRITCCDT